MTGGIAGQLTLYDALGSPPPERVPADRAGSPVEVAEAAPTCASTRGAAPEPQLESEPEPEPELTIELPPLEVRVTRSKKRKKTAQASVVQSVLEVRIPARCSREEEARLVEHFRAKFERSRTAALVDLDERAAELAERYDLPTPSSIRWVSNQRHQWGSCTPVDRTIRLSDRMAGFPRWVVDYVIVHELAHLVEADHGPAFWALVERYPKTERARGYLLAKDEG